MFNNLFVIITFTLCIWHNACCYNFSECLYGFPEALLPLSTGNQQDHLRSGSYIFPNITIQCHGKITAIYMSVYFDPDVLYSPSLKMLVAFFTLTGIHYKPAIAHYLQWNLKIDKLQQPSQFFTDGSGRYNVSKPQLMSLTYKLGIPLQVFPGYILGIILPPTELLPSTVVSNGISIAVLNDTSSETLTTSYLNGYANTRASENWYPVKGMIPVIQMDFEEGNWYTYHILMILWPMPCMVIHDIIISACGVHACLFVT